MIKHDKYIEIVRSSIPTLSSMGQESCDAIFAVLAKHYTKVRVTVVNNAADLEALAARQPDLVFLGVKFVPLIKTDDTRQPDKLWLASYLENRGIAYTGSRHTAHALEFNKGLAKQRAIKNDLKTAPFWIIKQGQLPLKPDFDHQYPLFIKPSNRGGGSGVDSNSVVHNFAELQSKVQSLASNLQADSLIEEYLPGREFSVAILKDEASTEYLVMPIELIAPPDKYGVRMLSAEIKTADTEQGIKVVDGTIKSEVCELAINIFRALGARDYGRIDIRLDASGRPHFLEANLMPSLKRSSGNYFPKACLLNNGLDYKPMIIKITELALARAVDNIEIELEAIALANAIPLVA